MTKDRERWRNQVEGYFPVVVAAAAAVVVVVTYFEYMAVKPLIVPSYKYTLFSKGLQCMQ